MSFNWRPVVKIALIVLAVLAIVKFARPYLPASLQDKI